MRTTRGWTQFAAQQHAANTYTLPLRFVTTLLDSAIQNAAVSWTGCLHTQFAVRLLQHTTLDTDVVRFWFAYRLYACRRCYTQRGNIPHYADWVVPTTQQARTCGMVPPVLRPLYAYRSTQHAQPGCLPHTLPPSVLHVPVYGCWLTPMPFPPARCTLHHRTPRGCLVRFSVEAPTSGGFGSASPFLTRLLCPPPFGCPMAVLPVVGLVIPFTFSAPVQRLLPTTLPAHHLPLRLAG